MKATLEFNLPDEEHQFRAARRVKEIVDAMIDVDMYCRHCLQDEATPDSVKEHITEVVCILDNVREYIE